jgi:hypothetical protein
MILFMGEWFRHAAINAPASGRAFDGADWFAAAHNTRLQPGTNSLLAFMRSHRV